MRELDRPAKMTESWSGHVWYECRGCERGCAFCDGGLSACTVCGGLEGSLPTHCPGAQMDEFTAGKVYALELDFVHGQWVRGALREWWRGDVLRGEPLSPLEVGNVVDEVKALGSMERAKRIRGWHPGHVHGVLVGGS